MKVTDDGVPVDELISVVKNSVRRAGISRTRDSGDLEVASVQLTLEVMATTTVGGGINFCIPFIGMKLRAGGKVTQKDTHTIDITLMPPGSRDKRQVRGGDIEQTLVDAIATIRKVMDKASEGDDPWILSESMINLSFAVTNTGTISLGIDGELANELTHTLRLGVASVLEATSGA